MAVKKHPTGPRPTQGILGKNIAELRAAKGLTQLDLATKAKIDPQHLSKIERGTHSPRFSTVEAIAEALGVTVAALSAPPQKRQRRSLPPSAA